MTTPPGPYNVVAAFPDDDAASAAVESLAADGIPTSAIVRHAPGEASPDQIAALRAEMQDELAEGWAAPSGVALTGSQAKGAFAGTAVAASIGAAIGLLVGLVWGSVVLMVFLGILGGATVGFLVGGIQRPRALAGERGYLVAVHAGERQTAERAAAVLEKAGAERVDLVDAGQTPLPPQAENPRPADPPGFWWRRAGHG